MTTFTFSTFFCLSLCFSQASAAPPEAKSPSKPDTTAKNADQAPAESVKAPKGMAFIPGGTYMRGSQGKQDNGKIYAEEGPVHKTTVSPFFIDVTEVTNAQFKAFVDATGYQTFAERGLSAKDFPKAPPEMLKPGAAIFTPPSKKIDPHRSNAMSWWPFTPGASWKHPSGPDSNLDGLMDHPVVCVNHIDAAAYAQWAGKRLPTEAEWEFAARGGLIDKKYAWGDKRYPDKWMANVFQGEFPGKNTKQDGFERTAPVKSFPANGYGLYDMSGNVWEMCSDYYRPTYYREFLGKEAINPQGPAKPITDAEVAHWRQHKRLPEAAADTNKLLFLRVTKGGSFLCHVDYCLRYRPAARHHTELITPTNHTGFRCAQDIKKK